jgi:hypothetical protein
MSDVVKAPEQANAVDAVVTPVAPAPQQQPIEIEVDMQTAFQLKLQEFDKVIAIAEAQAADLKKQKMSTIYDYNLQMITEQHKQKLIQKQVQDELEKRKKPN